MNLWPSMPVTPRSTLVTRDAAQIHQQANPPRHPMSTTKPPPVAQTHTPPRTAPAHPTPGQPAPAKPPICAAKRQRAYRYRTKRAAIQAIGDEASASRVALLALLVNTMAALDDQTTKSMHSACRNTARRVIREIVTRYDIKLDD